MAHYECRYCDRPAGYMSIPISVGDELVCVCGAEWADAKILVEEDIEEDSFMSDEYNDWETDGHQEDDEDDIDGEYICGCKWSTGCICDYWEETEANES